MTRFKRFESPLGPVLATANEHGITGIYFVGQRYEIDIERDWREEGDDPMLTECARQLGEYFEGERREFDLARPPGALLSALARYRAHPLRRNDRYRPSRAARERGSARAAGAATEQIPSVVLRAKNGRQRQPHRLCREGWGSKTRLFDRGAWRGLI